MKKTASEVLSNLINKKAGLISDLKSDLAMNKDYEDKAKLEESRKKNIKIPGLAGTLASAGGSALAMLPVKKYFTTNEAEKMTAAEAEAKVRQYANLGKAKIDQIKHDGSIFGDQAGPHYIHGQKPTINTGAEGKRSINKRFGDFIMAHEVGHGMDYQHHPVKANLRDAAGMVAPAAAGTAIGMLNRKHFRDKLRRLDKGNEKGKWNKAMDFAEKHPFVVGAGLGTAAGLTTLLPREIAADVNAYKVLKQTMPKGEAVKKALGGSARQLANYAIVSGLSGGVSGATTAGMTRYSEKKRELRDKHNQDTILRKSAGELDDYLSRARDAADQYGLTPGALAWRGGGLGAGAGLAVGNYLAERKSKKLRDKAFGPPPRLKDYASPAEYEQAKMQYDHHATQHQASGDSLKRYLGTTGLGGLAGAGIGAGLGAVAGHVLKKKASDYIAELIEKE